MYAGAVCGLRVRLVVKNSIAIVLVGVLPCTQLASGGCGSFRSGIEFCRKP